MTRGEEDGETSREQWRKDREVSGKGSYGTGVGVEIRGGEESGVENVLRKTIYWCLPRGWG